MSASTDWLSIWRDIDWAILGPAFLAGLLVLVTHVPLGMRVLERGIVFIDLAIAQVAGLGVILADRVGAGEQGLAVQAAAVGAALAGAALLAWTERRAGSQHEAFIGVLFVLASCVGVLVLAGNPHGGEHLKDLLVGQILWTGPTQLLALGAVSAVIVGVLWVVGPQRLERLGFYALFAVAVTASVQVVGVYLVFCSLIVPALATTALRGGRRLLAAGVVGVLGYALGLVLSAAWDLPSGAVIVCAMAACGLALRIELGHCANRAP